MYVIMEEVLGEDLETLLVSIEENSKGILDPSSEKLTEWKNEVDDYVSELYKEMDERKAFVEARK